MTTISHATYPRAICNWRPSETRTVAVFKPGILRDAEAKAKFRKRGPLLEPERGVGETSVVMALELLEDAPRRILSFQVKPLGDIGLELTRQGPKLFEATGPEVLGRSGNYFAIDADTVDGSIPRKIAASIFNGTTGFRLFYLAASQFTKRVWWGRVAPPFLTGSNLRTFFVLASEEFTDLLNGRRKDGYRFVFLPCEETRQKERARMKIMHMADERLRDSFGIDSHFNIDGRVVKLSTRYRTEHGKMCTYTYPYDTAIFVDDQLVDDSYIGMYKTQAEAETAHWELVGKMKRGDIPFLDELNKTMESAMEAEAA